MKKDTLLIFLSTLALGSPLYWFQSRTYVNFGVDWRIAFYPATILLLQGQNPYQVTQLHNPVWALIPLIPFALLGAEYGQVVLFFFNLFSFAYVAYRIRHKPVAYAAFLLSPLVYYNLFLGNIDTLVLWGMFFPPAIGFFLLSIKPQVGIGIAVYWVFAIWRGARSIRRVIASMLPVGIALAASFLLFGNWLQDRSDHLLNGAYWNVSLFPWSIPIGLGLIVIAVWKSRLAVSIAASAFLSPYLSMGSWAFALMGLLDNNIAMVGVVSGAWLLYVLAGARTFSPIFSP